MLVAACPARVAAKLLLAVPPYGWGVTFGGETAFSFVGKGGVFTLRWFFACPAGAKTAFSFDSKEKAVLDSEKEKVDQWKSWGGALQQDRSPMLRCCSSGKILWAILLSSAACV